MRRSAALLLCAVAASTLISRVGAEGKVVDCGGSAAHGHFDAFSLDPPTPVKGQAITLLGNGTIDEVVTAGQARATVLLNGNPLFGAPVSTCGLTNVPLPMGLGTVEITGLECPTTVHGPISLRVALTLPAIAPAGSYTLQLDASDENSDKAFCAQAQFSL